MAHYVQYTDYAIGYAVHDDDVIQLDNLNEASLLNMRGEELVANLESVSAVVSYIENMYPLDFSGGNSNFYSIGDTQSPILNIPPVDLNW